MHKFKIIKNDKGFRIQFVYNKEVIFWTESYSKKPSAMNALKSLRAKAALAPLEEVDETAKAVAAKKEASKKVVAKVAKKTPAKK